MQSNQATSQDFRVRQDLANILLNEMNQGVLQHSHKYVRYADDIMEFYTSGKAVEESWYSLEATLQRSPSSD